jgi:hypothetical protein
MKVSHLRLSSIHECDIDIVNKHVGKAILFAHKRSEKIVTIGG